jgi:hypothetical protein
MVFFVLRLRIKGLKGNQRSNLPIVVIIKISEDFPKGITGVDNHRYFIINNIPIIFGVFAKSFKIFHFIVLLDGAANTGRIGSGRSFGVAANEDGGEFVHDGFFLRE